MATSEQHQNWGYSDGYSDGLISQQPEWEAGKHPTPAYEEGYWLGYWTAKGEVE